MSGERFQWLFSRYPASCIVNVASPLLMQWALLKGNKHFKHIKVLANALLKHSNMELFKYPNIVYLTINSYHANWNMYLHIFKDNMFWQCTKDRYMIIGISPRKKNSTKFFLKNHFCDSCWKGGFSYYGLVRVCASAHTRTQTHMHIPLMFN